MTHAFHPLLGREFVFLAVRQTWSEDRVFVLDGDGRQCSFPVGWTDAVEPDVFVSFAAGRSPFRVDDLLSLSPLIAGPVCKVDYAAVRSTAQVDLGNVMHICTGDRQSSSCGEQKVDGSAGAAAVVS